MKTSEFIELLENHPGLELAFEYQSNAYVRGDYHITEIKNVSYDTVDCGGQQNNWQETHVQLWENEITEPEHSVDTTKALKIFQTVDRIRPVYMDVPIKFEYGNANFPTVVLPVDSVEIQDTMIIIRLTSDQATCKAKDRAGTPEEAASVCCSVSRKQSINIPENTENVCIPGGGCC